MKTVQFPIDELRDAGGLVSNVRVGDLSRDDIVRTLRRGKIRFVIADIGQPLNWIPIEDCYSFWKGETSSHLISPYDSKVGVVLENLKDGYGYTASEWQADGFPIILLQKWH